MVLTKRKDPPSGAATPKGGSFFSACGPSAIRQATCRCSKMLHSLRQTAQTYKRIPSGNTSLPNNVGGRGRKTSIAYFSTKRNRNEHIPPARGRKPLPMGEVALRSNDGEGKPLGEPFQLHDTAPLRWNKWRSFYKLNDTSLNIGCSPTWRSSPDWRSTYFASWAQVRHLGEVCFMTLVR